jgi:predicted metal-dependent hydrolase
MKVAPPKELRPPDRPLSRAEFRAEVEAWAQRLGVRPKVIQVRQMRRKWGSCSARGRVTFAADLLGQHPEFRQRVIVEELLHLRVPNHGKLFRALLGAYLAGETTRAQPVCRVG